MDFENAVGYDRGAVLVDLILSITEQKYVGSYQHSRKKKKID